MPFCASYKETYQENTYEEDTREYEDDNVNPEDISESMEYEEDDVYEPEEESEEPETSLYEASTNDFGATISFDSSALNKEISSVEDEEEWNKVKDVLRELSKSE